MTLSEIKTYGKDYITPAQAAGPLGCDPHYIRVAARDDPASLGFPVTRVGRRVKIPRIAFIRHMEGANEKEVEYPCKK